jgi:hypothetical protein
MYTILTPSMSTTVAPLPHHTYTANELALIKLVCLQEAEAMPQFTWEELYDTIVQRGVRPSNARATLLSLARTALEQNIPIGKV